ncbi:MAG TPA: hypothetical protein DDW49_01050, partial [Deltaproteobacteria bacterium]|nr:hypothetical protein [Deltaproteobacteria bacterium]
MKINNQKGFTLIEL